MSKIEKEVLELVEKIEAGVDEYMNVNKVISILKSALEDEEVDMDFVLEIDERLGLEYF